MDGTPLRCGASRVTVNRSGLGEIAGYGRDASHHAFYWGAKLMLVTTADGAVAAFSLAHPKELDERKQALHLAHVQTLAPRPVPDRVRQGVRRGRGRDRDGRSGTRAHPAPAR
ncbi:hypothetical protein [Nocardiopsis sp. YSL2]|uniref:hypothetical protein n=1 Tax=Nocardiopsis sp. YSL2 TaxID=2939492 RepID=UPI0026F42D80|nr:hypothetical protein [Nocardiopsis sp. YSL2]